MVGVCSICTQSVPNKRSTEWSVPNLYPHEMSSTSVITGNGLPVTGRLAFYPFKLSSRNGLKLSVEHMPLSLTTIYHYPGTRSISATRSTIWDNALSVRLKKRHISIIHTGCLFENNLFRSLLGVAEISSVIVQQRPRLVCSSALHCGFDK